MNIKDSKQTSADRIHGGKEGSPKPSLRPGYINFGPHLNRKNSLKARLRAEIDRAIRGDRL